MKVAYLTNIPTPYKTALFNKIQENVDRFRVFFMAPNEYHRQWENPLEKSQFEHTILKGIHLKHKRNEWTWHINLSIISNLKKFKPDYVIIGPYSQITSLIAILYCRIAKIKLAIWYESPSSTERYTGKFIRFIKKCIFAQFNSYIVPSELVKKNLQRFVKSSNIQIAHHAVNNEFFKSQHKNFLSSINQVKTQLNINERKKTIYIYVGRFVSIKGIDKLLKAYARTNFLKESILLLVGDGPEKENLNNLINQLSIQTNVKFIPFQQQEELIKYYCIADILILPSLKEVWGLVVNEAMACKNAIIASKYIGAKELVQDNINGFIIDPNNINNFAARLDEVVYRKEEFKENSYAIIDQYSMERMAEKFINALK